MKLTEQLSKMRGLICVLENIDMDRENLKQMAINAIGDIKADYARKEFANNLDLYLKDVAEQLNSPSADVAAQTRQMFGDTICDVAQKLYPNASMDLTQHPYTSA